MKYRAKFYAYEKKEDGTENLTYKGSFEFFVFHGENPNAIAFRRATIEQQNANRLILEVL